MPSSYQVVLWKQEMFLVLRIASGSPHAVRRKQKRYLSIFIEPLVRVRLRSLTEGFRQRCHIGPSRWREVALKRERPLLNDSGIPIPDPQGQLTSINRLDAFLFVQRYIRPGTSGKAVEELLESQDVCRFKIVQPNQRTIRRAVGKKLQLHHGYRTSLPLPDWVFPQPARAAFEKLARIWEEGSSETQRNRGRCAL